jgi:phosphoglycerol transferase
VNQDIGATKRNFNVRDWMPAVVVSSLLILIALRKSGISIFRPLQGGDLYAAYALTGRHNFCNLGDGPQYGYPAGMSPGYFPSSDLLITIPANLVSCVFQNTFIGLNLLWILSFPVVAFVSSWVFHQIQITRYVSFVCSLGITFLPYHWQRIGHVYLATMYATILGLGLVFWIAGQVDRKTLNFDILGARKKRRLFWLGSITMAIAWGGVYYSVFTLILLSALIAYLSALGVQMKKITQVFIPISMILCWLLAAYIPSFMFSRNFPNTQNQATRSAIESFIYSGNLDRMILLSPETGLPIPDVIRNLLNGFDAMTYQYNLPMLGESGWFSNILVFTAWVVIALGSLAIFRKRNMISREIQDSAIFATVENLKLVLYLLGVVILFVVPWGLNVLFAGIVTPQIRAWGRLEPLIGMLVLCGFGLILTYFLSGRKKVEALLVTFLTAVLIVDISKPLTNYLGYANGLVPVVLAAEQYSEVVNSVDERDCGVLQIPFIPYPEGPVSADLGKEENFLVPLLNQSKNWSYAQYRGDPRGGLSEQLGNKLEASDVETLLKNGFCGVHLDTRGFTADERESIYLHYVELFGKEDATGMNGTWKYWALPAS